MENNKNIDAFINYKFIPFSIAQCIKRIVWVWILSIALCFIGRPVILWLIPFVLISLIISGAFIILIVKLRSSKISRFLCDGIFFLYISLLLNLASYRIIAIQIGQNWLLFIILLLLLIINILVFAFITMSNIKADNFSGTINAKKIGCTPLIAGGCGILTAKIFLTGQSQETALMIIVITLLIISFLLAVGSLNLVKAILYKRLK